MYGKVFAQLWEGSLYGQEAAILVFTYFIATCDKDGVVDRTPERIVGETGYSPETVAKGLATLEAPDPRSRTPTEDGRRIVRLDAHRDWGWRIVNYAHYRALMSREDKREYDRQYRRDERERQRTTESDGARQVGESRKSSQKSSQAVSSKQRQRKKGSTDDRVRRILRDKDSEAGGGR